MTTHKKRTKTAKIMAIKDNYDEIIRRIAEAAERSGRSLEDITLVAVTKTHGADEINEVIDAGATDIGENRVQEMLEKYDSVKDVRWHLIGHLQTNKVKNVIGKVVMIHSVDSLKLAKEIDKRSEAAGLVTDILIEINSAMEETKSGIDSAELKELCEEICRECEHVRIRGLMCIPPIAIDPEDARPYFIEAAALFKEMQSWGLPIGKFSPDELSMGMSGDFEVAIEEGATIVRVGSSIFGPRNYR